MPVTYSIIVSAHRVHLIFFQKAHFMKRLSPLLIALSLMASPSAFAGTDNHEKHGNHEKHAHHNHDNHAHNSDQLMVMDVVIRATTPNAGATAAYGIIHNHSTTDDRLIGASVSFAKKAEIHEMKIEGDVMKMRELEGGLIIPAGEMVSLAMGAEHVMIIGLSGPIIQGDSYQISFEFEKAGIITAKASTISLSGKPAAHSHNH
jgi:copper(I)-binding protein